VENVIYNNYQVVSSILCYIFLFKRSNLTFNLNEAKLYGCHLRILSTKFAIKILPTFPQWKFQ